MKTAIDIPDIELEDAMRFTNAKTKREAVVTAITDFNQRKRMAGLIKHAGTCSALITPEILQEQRRPSWKLRTVTSQGWKMLS